jgi:hypothetical protein
MEGNIFVIISNNLTPVCNNLIICFQIPKVLSIVAPLQIEGYISIPVCIAE